MIKQYSKLAMIVWVLNQNFRKAIALLIFLPICAFAQLGEQAPMPKVIPKEKAEPTLEETIAWLQKVPGYFNQKSEGGSLEYEKWNLSIEPSTCELIVARNMWNFDKEYREVHPISDNISLENIQQGFAPWSSLIYEIKLGDLDSGSVRPQKQSVEVSTMGRMDKIQYKSFSGSNGFGVVRARNGAGIFDPSLENHTTEKAYQKFKDDVSNGRGFNPLGDLVGKYGYESKLYIWFKDEDIAMRASRALKHAINLCQARNHLGTAPDSIAPF